MKQGSSLTPTPRRHAAVKVVPVGELDIATCDKFRDAIENALAQPCDTLVVDFAKVTFIDSSGLKCLALAHNGMLERRGIVEIRNASPEVRRIIEIVGLHQVVSLAD